jgi:hypothetical protein
MAPNKFLTSLQEFNKVSLVFESGEKYTILTEQIDKSDNINFEYKAIHKDREGEKEIHFNKENLEHIVTVKE